MDGRVPQKSLPEDSVESPAEDSVESPAEVFCGSLRRTASAEATAPAAEAAAASESAENEGRKQNGTEAAA